MPSRLPYSLYARLNTSRVLKCLRALLLRALDVDRWLNSLRAAFRIFSAHPRPLYSAPVWVVELLGGLLPLSLASENIIAYLGQEKKME